MKHKISQEEKFQMMTTAPIPSLIGKMAVPTIISMLITSIYNIADTFFVSRLGTSATASVGIVFPVMAIIQALGFLDVYKRQLCRQNGVNHLPACAPALLNQNFL